MGVETFGKIMSDEAFNDRFGIRLNFNIHLNTIDKKE